MPDRPTPALRALTDSLETALSGLSADDPQRIADHAHAVRDALYALRRSEESPAPEDLRRTRALLDRYQLEVNRRLNVAADGLQALGRGQPVYAVAGHGAAASEPSPRARS